MIKKVKKIGIVIDRLNVGGVEKIAIQEVKALRELGQDTHLVVLRRKGVVENAFADLRNDLPIIFLDDRLPKILTFSFKFPLFNFFSFFHITYPFLIPFVVRSSEFDYLIVHGTYTALSTINIKRVKKINSSTFIWDPIEYILQKAYSEKFSVFAYFFKNVAKHLDKIIIDNSDFILTGGDAHDKYFKKISPKAKIKSIPPSVNPTNVIRKVKKNYLLIVTAWKPGKNPEFVFNIIDKIPNLKIKMVGKWLDPLYKKTFFENLKKQKNASSVEVVGAVTEKELFDYYTRALAVLQINDDRGFGMPALEAAGQGTTFIIPKGQGVCKLFKSGIDGYFTEEKDTTEIVNCLKKLLKNDELAVKMGEHAWKTVKEKYSWEKHAEKLLDIITRYEK